MTGTRPCSTRPFRRLRPTRACSFALDDGLELIFDDPRRFGTGELALGATAREAFFAARLGRRAARARLHERAPVRADARQPRAGEGVPARPAQGRRRRQHLRRRGALPRAHPSAARRRGRLSRGAVRGAARRDGGRRSRRASPPRARRSTTSAIPTASRAPSRTASSSTGARASRAWSAAGPSRKLRAAGRGTYVCERCQPRPRRAALRPRRQLGQPAGAVGRGELLKAADRLAVDDDLREGHHARAGDELGAPVGVLGQVDLLVRDAAPLEERLCRPAVAARFSGVNDDVDPLLHKV